MNTYQILDFLKTKTFSLCQMVQKTARSSNLGFEGSITEKVSTDEDKTICASMEEPKRIKAGMVVVTKYFSGLMQ